MPAIGDLQNKFGRSWIFLNPTDPAGVGGWRLTADDDYVPTDVAAVSPNEGTCVLDNSSPALKKGQLIYIDAAGKGKPAIATSIVTARVAGVLLADCNPNATCTFARNGFVDITAPSDSIDNPGSDLTTNTYYYLSSTNAGNWTTTPNTTTSGYVVVNCGLATSGNKMLVEIQVPTVI